MTRRKLTLITTLLLTLPFTPLPTTHAPLLPPTAHARSHIESVPRDTDGDPEEWTSGKPSGLKSPGATSEIVPVRTETVIEHLKTVFKFLWRTIRWTHV